MNQMNVTGAEGISFRINNRPVAYGKTTTVPYNVMVRRMLKNGTLIEVKEEVKVQEVKVKVVETKKKKKKGDK